MAKGQRLARLALASGGGPPCYTGYHHTTGPTQLPGPGSTSDAPKSVAQVSEILARIDTGRIEAAGDLLPIVYKELRALARHRMADEKPGQTLQTTALVHEAYVRLVGSKDPKWANRAHFFAAAADAMRRILIDRARKVARQKHGGGQKRVTANEFLATDDLAPEDLLELDQALSRLEANDEEMAAVVKLRYFAGLTIEETASALNISPRSVNRIWIGAKAWLRLELIGGSAAGE